MHCRPLVVAMFLFACLFLGFRAASAEEIWQVRSGQTTLHFNVHLMKDLGLEIVDIQGNVPTPHDVGDFMEVPHWTFPIGSTSDLSFKVEAGIAVPGGIVGGAIHHSGSFRIVEMTSKAEIEIKAPEIAFESPERYAPSEGPDPNPLYLRSAGAGSPIVIEFVYSMFRLLPKDQILKIHYLNMRISPKWAASLGRPDLGDWVIGGGEVVADVEHVSGVSTSEPYEPHFGGGPLDSLDVKLGILEGIQQAGHEGVHPNGAAGITMATTSCNVGTVDVPWLAPMQENHPLIHMALYRLLDGRLEQIGVSYMKHGFYALSNSQCTQCLHPSDGSFLGIGCSDTYGQTNNSDRRFLGPRREVNPYLGTWECLGSHFDGPTPDCEREHGAGGHGPIDHMLISQDADLNNPGATYYYESYYIVRSDEIKHNNWGSRICTMSWSGSVWNFTTPSAGNPLIEGPALERFGDLRTTVPVPGDGQALLAVKTKDLGGGDYHYEYALLNMDSERQIRSFSLPVTGVPNITNIGFHDGDTDAANDWQVTFQDGAITWQTETYAQNPNAHALEFGLMFNFRFDAGAAPEAGAQATFGLFKPAPPAGVDEVTASTIGPQLNTTALVAAASPRAKVTLSPGRPNPLHPSATIGFDLPGRETVRLEVFDAAGRLVRTLVDRTMPGGAHEVVWDGKRSGGERVGSAVYYVRLKAGSEIVVRPLLVVD